jgi:hypothetical protein
MTARIDRFGISYPISALDLGLGSASVPAQIGSIHDPPSP